MRFPFLLLLLGTCLLSFGARVDSIEVYSAAMNKTYMAAVVRPNAYATGKSAYPVLYLLHGGGGHFRDWLQQPPDKQLVHRLADQYNLLVVMPEGEVFSWYLNSPLLKESQFETYITRELVKKIDSLYRTVPSNKGRVITGLSMGGHGALYLSARHPELFAAAGSMSGALDLNLANWRIDTGFARSVRTRFEPLLGPVGGTNDQYAAHSVVGMADRMKANGLPLIIDCGVDDFLIEPNRELHRRLLYNKTPHEYTERPGGHTWLYWEQALPHHVLFFHRVLKAHGTAVP